MIRSGEMGNVVAGDAEDEVFDEFTATRSSLLVLDELM